MEYCLPRDKAQIFLEALKGPLAPGELRVMTSAERRARFAEILGPENAKDVNALFENGLLKKFQYQAMKTWAKEVTGIPEDIQKDIVDQVQSFGKILDNKSPDKFYEDIAAKKLGVTVSNQEAQEIFDMSKEALKAKEDTMKDISNVSNRIAYGRKLMDLQDKIESMKPDGRPWTEKALDVLNIPKSMLTSVLHFSAPFVQGWGMMSTSQFYTGFGQMFKYWASEENFKNLQAYIITHPDYNLARDGGLGLTDLSDKLSQREEALMSTLVQKASAALSTKIGIDPVAASSRAFVGYLNYVRFNRFTQILDANRLAGEDVSIGSSNLRSIAKTVNDFTGRGNIGFDNNIGANSKSIQALNAFFFAPRKIAATMEMFDPTAFINASPTTRMARMRQLTGSLAITAAVVGLAMESGADVNWNPTSQDFMKINIEGQKFDMTGGNMTFVRLMSRLLMNKEQTAKGKDINLGEGYKPTTRADLVEQYFRGKLSPIAGAIADALHGTDPVGRPFSLSQEASDKLLPITIGSWLDFANHNPKATAAIIPAISAMFGIEMQSPLPPLQRQGLTPFGDKDEYNEKAVQLTNELNKLGINPSFPPKTINGVKLTDDQYHDYIAMSGQLGKGMVDKLISNENWGNIPKGVRAKTAKATLDSAKKIAITPLQMKYSNILQDSMKAQLKKAQGALQ